MGNAIRTSFLENYLFYFSNGMTESFLYCVGLRYENVKFLFLAGTNFSEQKLNVKAVSFTENSARTFQATRRHNPTNHKMNLHHSPNLKSRKIFFVLSSFI
jgi:hypothetical protein